MSFPFIFFSTTNDLLPPILSPFFIKVNIYLDEGISIGNTFFFPPSVTIINRAISNPFDFSPTRWWSPFVFLSSLPSSLHEIINDAASDVTRASGHDKSLSKQGTIIGGAWFQRNGNIRANPLLIIVTGR